MQKYLSFTQVCNLIASVGHKRTIIVEGENGIGKTALFHALKRMPKFANHIAVDPIDCTQLSDGSVWMPDLDRENGVSRELPNERFGLSKNNQLGVNNAKPVLIALDEIAKAPQFIKNVLAPIIYERRVGNLGMPEGSVVFCATNLATEGLGDSIQAHLRNRLVFVKMRKPTTKEWVQWAVDNRVSDFHVQADSELLVKQMRGQYRVKNEGLQPLFQRQLRTGEPFHPLLQCFGRHLNNFIFFIYEFCNTKLI